MNIIEIYFDNLDAETQNELLEAYGVSTPEEMNWDVLPVTIITVK